MLCHLNYILGSSKLGDFFKKCNLGEWYHFSQRSAVRYDWYGQKRLDRMGGACLCMWLTLIQSSWGLLRTASGHQARNSYQESTSIAQKRMGWYNLLKTFHSDKNTQWKVGLCKISTSETACRLVEIEFKGNIFENSYSNNLFEVKHCNHQEKHLFMKMSLSWMNLLL